MCIVYDLDSEVTLLSPVLGWVRPLIFHWTLWAWNGKAVTTHAVHSGSLLDLNSCTSCLSPKKLSQPLEQWSVWQYHSLFSHLDDRDLRDLCRVWCLPILYPFQGYQKLGFLTCLLQHDKLKPSETMRQNKSPPLRCFCHILKLWWHKK